MTAGRKDELDPRTWLLWGVAASLPPLLGRNPWPLAATLAAVIGVRLAWSGAAPRAASWSGIVRLAGVFAVVGALFNALTVRAGDRELFRLPDGLPLVGGAVTANALVYGLLSGLALLTLVLIWTTVGALFDWPAALRLLPDRLATVAVAGSVAFAFVPQTAVAWREIREAQLARGRRPRGARDWAELVAPLLTGGLERALTLAEALESRAYGAPRAGERPTPGRGALIALGLTAAVAAAYLLAVARPWAAGASAGIGLVAVTAASRAGHGVGLGRTRYRTARLGRRDAVAIAGSLAAMIGTLTASVVDPTALRYEPYPALVEPTIGLALMAALAGLAAPAMVVEESRLTDSPHPPTPSSDREREGDDAVPIVSRLRSSWTMLPAVLPCDLGVEGSER